MMQLDRGICRTA